MRLPALLFACIFALVSACGGKTGDLDGVHGGSRSSGSGSSGGSGGSGSGGSSGGSGSSSGVGSGGGSGSSSGVTPPGCQPLPGCDSSTDCPFPNGCGFCVCDNGSWACTGTGCGDDETDASPPEDATAPSCPLNPPGDGQACGPSGLSCGYDSNEGCGTTCTCDAGAWQCGANPCPGGFCPAEAPTSGQSCTGVGNVCYYAVNGCGTEDCECDPSGHFDCAEFCDGGAPVDTGPPDSGIASCPASQPSDQTSCAQEGALCAYFNGCETNCLCTHFAWVCATQLPCSQPEWPGSK